MEIRNFDAKQYFTVLITILLLTDLVILLNVPFLRQILGFHCFTIIPGLLILHILKLNKMEFLEKFVLSVGLSVAFLIFAGLLVNSLYPFIFKPLSLVPILTSFNGILLTLAYVAYKRNKDDFDRKDVFNFELDLKDKLTSPLIFPFLLPFMAVLGAHLMNTQGNNIILLVMLFLIPAYVVAVVFSKDRISEATYPIAILTIGMALVLMFSLRSDHILGTDSSGEYYYSSLTMVNMHWTVILKDPFYLFNYNTCLSIALLPVIYNNLLNIHLRYIYKIILQIIISITPLTLYLLFKKYIDHLYAFLASLLFISQYLFINSLINNKTAIAVFFFSLAIAILFNNKIDKLSKKILFIVFTICVILSHYATSYIFFVLMLASSLLSELIKRGKQINFEKNISFEIVAILFTIIFLWSAYITQTPFYISSKYIERTFMSMINMFNIEARSPLIQKAFGINLSGIPEIINLISYYLVYFFIFIGLIKEMWNYKTSKFGVEFISLANSCFLLLLISIAIPFIVIGYSLERILLQLLVILSPFCIIGCKTFFKKSNFTLLIALILIGLQLMTNTELTWQVWGEPRSIVFNSEGYKYTAYWVHDQELMAAGWLKENRDPDLPVYCDIYARTRLWLKMIPDTDFRFFENNKTVKSGYIYLGYQNVVEKLVTPVPPKYKIPEKVFKPITTYSHLFTGKSKIYNNGGSSVYK